MPIRTSSPLAADNRVAPHRGEPSDRHVWRRRLAVYAVLAAVAIGLSMTTLGGRSSSVAQGARVSVFLPVVMNAVALTDLERVPTAPAPTASPFPPTIAAPTEAPSATAMATSAPPSATAEPTSTATETTMPTATATTEPAEELVCENVVRNGGFEAGARDWTLIVTSMEQALRLAILRRAEAPIPPVEGEYLAYLGGLNDTTFTLHSARIPRFDPEEIVKATLRYHVALITEEVPDRRHGDELRAYIDATRRVYLTEVDQSEETLQPPRSWNVIEADVTHLMERGVRHVGLDVVTDRGRNSWFYLDNVALELCRLP